jgi:prevent-host-death family protein
MKTVGLFEAKAKLSRICSMVESRRQPVLVTRRGRPIVRITPLTKPKRKSVWDTARQHRSKHPPEEDFTPPARAKIDFKNWFKE